MTDPVDELYARDPGEFIAARNELAKELKKAGDKDRAAEVGKLRRPSVAAWVVNQLARQRRAEVEDLLRAGEELRAANADALGGGDPDALRQAARSRRDAVAHLVEQAADILAEHGSSPDAHRDAIASTLDAASLDPETGGQVLQGRLTSELSAPSGLGEQDLAAALAASTTPSPGAARHKARQEAKSRQAEADRAEARAAAARHRLEKAEAEVASAEQALNAARRRARQAAEDAAEAERAASEARQEAARASDAAGD